MYINWGVSKVFGIFPANRMNVKPQFCDNPGFKLYWELDKNVHFLKQFTVYMFTVYCSVKLTTVNV